ncbi:MAG: PIN domain-containing protein [Acetobacteraceae bacterium]
MAAKRNRSDPDAAKFLLFIDTNIWLDFYRMEGAEGAAEALELIEHAKERIIITDQVQMEFLKHRQKTILLMLERFKSSEAMALPPIVADRKAAQAMRAQKKAMDERRLKLRRHVESILTNPATRDPVYRAMQSLFTEPGDLVLCRPKDERYAIRALAEKRWRLGYPPRKDDDTSIGDAINWEWVVNCASRRGGHVIIVSRDHDYGRPYNGQVFLNDWLLREYKERVPGRCKIVLTNRLSSALRRMDVQVSKVVIEAEGALVEASAHLSATARVLPVEAMVEQG